MCAELCLFSRSLNMQAAVQSAPRDKSLIFRPSAESSSRRRLRLLSCHRTVGLLSSVKRATKCDILRTTANQRLSAALNKTGAQSDHEPVIMQRRVCDRHVDCFAMD